MKLVRRRRGAYLAIHEAQLDNDLGLLTHGSVVSQRPNCITVRPGRGRGEKSTLLGKGDNVNPSLSANWVLFFNRIFSPFPPYHLLGEEEEKKVHLKIRT